MIWLVYYMIIGMIVSIWVIQIDRKAGNDISWGELILFPVYSMIGWPYVICVVSYHIGFWEKLFKPLSKVALKGKVKGEIE